MQYETIGIALLQKRSRVDDFQHQAFLAQVSPCGNTRFDDPAVSSQIAELQKQRMYLTNKI